MLFADKTSFGGVCLEDYGIVVERVHDDVPEMREESEDVVGGDGSLFKGTQLPSRTITLECRAFEHDWQDFDALRDTLLAAFLSVRTERELKVRTRPDEHYLAHFLGYSEGDRIGGSGIGAFTLTFSASCPYRYANETSSANLSSGGTATFEVGGTCPARVSVTSEAATRDSTTELWGVRFDDADFMRVSIPTSSQTAVSIDSESRRVSVGGANSMVTLDSDWVELAPGEHTVEMELGTGAAVISWLERSV